MDVTVLSLRPATDYYGSSDNFVATISFDDGSVATLTYTALGSPALSKERMDLFVDGSVLLLDDYKRLNLAGKSDAEVSTNGSEKGQRQELEALVGAIRRGGDWPIPLWQQVQATEIALRVQDHITGSS